MTTERIAVIVAVLATASVPNTGRAQVGFDVLNPNLSGFKVDASAGWNFNGYYEYSYVLTNGPSSTGALLVFQLDATKPSWFASGPTLPNSGAGRVFNFGTNPDVPPVGLIVPALWYGTVTPLGLVTWGIESGLDTGQLDITQMAPGKVSPPMGLRSHDPPGFREFIATPVWHASEPGVTVQGEEDIVYKLKTFGPVPRTSDEWYQTALMKYRSPAQTVTTLEAGAKATVIVSFATNIRPATFKATWNKADVTSRFVAAPGQFAAVELTPQSGRNVLIISVSGTKPSGGGTRSQTDRLTWDAP